MKNIRFLLIIVCLIPNVILANLSTEVNGVEPEVIEKYIKSISYYNDYGENTIYFEEEVTKKEYDSFSPSRGDCGSTQSFQRCWETNMKKITLGGYTSGGYTIISFSTYWKDVPLVTKYDDIAIRWEGSGTLYSVNGMQQATQNNNLVQTNYNTPSNLIKTTSNAAGITMNMYDNAEDHFMQINVIINGTAGDTYGTYQHARNSAITQNKAKSYSFSSSGLGGVLYFSDPIIRNYFDGMQGLTYTY